VFRAIPRCSEEYYIQEDVLMNLLNLKKEVESGG
jgi:hypothetical protein